MPLSTALPGLFVDIEKAYNTAVMNGSQSSPPNPPPDTPRILGSEMGLAVDTYYAQALVTTRVTVHAGQMDAPGGGSTTTTGTGSGTGSLSGLDVSTLKDSIYNAYKDAAKTGGEGNSVPQLAQDVSDAIHVYMISGVVTTAVTVDGGQITIGPTPSSIVPAPWPGSKFIGTVRFEPDNVDALKSDIETAYDNARSNGESSSSLEVLASDMQTAIDKFALTAIVETSGDVIGGQVVVPYVVPPTTIPSMTIQGTGDGEGELS